MQRIGVLGTGHFGKKHLHAIKGIENHELAGFYDIDDKTATQVENEFNIYRFPSYEAMLSEVDVIDIVVPTLSHFTCAVEAVRRQKHVFIEKPVTSTLEEAHTLQKLADEASVKVQVGHIERFNPAFAAALTFIKNPKYIEIHRLEPYSKQSSDLSVIQNLMIHDIDIVLSTVHSNLKKISACGVLGITNSTDLANARLEFDNGCVANITASRIAKSTLRRSRFFQKDMSIAIDFLNHKTEIIRTGTLHEYSGLSENTDIITPEVALNDSLQQELKSFLHSIEQNQTPLVPLDDGVRALAIAFEIIEKIKLSNDF